MISDLTLPSPYSRMGLPPLRTRNKDRAEEINSNPLETFINEQCYQVPGEMVEFAVFYKRFYEWLASTDPIVSFSATSGGATDAGILPAGGLIFLGSHAHRNYNGRPPVKD